MPMPMRIALISDIHGNLIALDAVLADIARHGVDRIVCLGDLAMSGPRPREVVARIRALGWSVVKGNCDDLVVAMRATGQPHDAAIARWAVEIDYWSATRLSSSDLAYLQALPPTVDVPLGDGATLLCVHGSPSSYTDRILPDTPDEQLDALLLPLPPGIHAIAAGHTHIPLARRYRGVTIVNPGSVGLPLARDQATGAIYNPVSLAEYALVDWRDDALDVVQRCVVVDTDAVCRDAAVSGMPHPERWRGDWRI